MILLGQRNDKLNLRRHDLEIHALLGQKRCVPGHQVSELIELRLLDDHPHLEQPFHLFLSRLLHPVGPLDLARDRPAVESEIDFFLDGVERFAGYRRAVVERQRDQERYFLQYFTTPPVRFLPLVSATVDGTPRLRGCHRAHSLRSRLR